MTEREQKIGDILDGLGVTLDMEDGDLIASALVLAKVVDSAGDVSLALIKSEGLSWIDQKGEGRMIGPSMADRPHQVRLTSNGLSGSVEIDGTDITSSVQGYNLEARAGSALLVLYATPQTGVQFEGLAHVAVGDQQDPGDTVAAFLANIDPAALQRAALNRDDLDNSPHELTRAMLMTLTDMALGKAAT
ncbi:hypothetical protein [Streptomyces microflavus]|uniref:hypothetical protein n=1 Tax=Streptomyces microflavus TaxID=1919 RepID=UPI003B210037